MPSDLNGVVGAVFDATNNALRVSNATPVGGVNVTTAPNAVPTDGTTDGSTLWQAKIDALTAAGGGVLWVPQGTYVGQNVVITANVTVMVAPGTVFKLPAVPANFAQWFTLGTKNWSDATYAEGPAIIGGPYTFDYTGHAAGKLLRGIEVANAHDFRVEGAQGIAIPDGCVVQIAANGAFIHPQVGAVSGIRATQAPNGYGAVQITGGYDIHFSRIISDAGFALNVETDIAGSTVDTVTADTVHVTGTAAGSFPNVAVQFGCHEQTIRNVTVTRAKAEGGAGGLSLGKTTGILDNVLVDGLDVAGGGYLVDIPGNDRWFDGVTIRNFHCDGSTTYGAEASGQVFDVGTITNCLGPGIQDTFRTAGYDSTFRTRLSRVKLLKNTTYGASFRYSDFHAVDCEFNDDPTIFTPITAQMLAANQDSGTLAGWTNANATGCTVSGAGGVLTLTANNTSPTEIVAWTATGTGGVPVVAGHYYKFSFAGALGTAAGTSGRASIWWYKSDGTLINADNGGTVVNLPATVSYWAQAPALAAFCAAVVKFEHTSAMTNGWTYTASTLTLAEMPGLATQNYGVNIGAGATATLVTTDISSNGAGTWTGSGSLVRAYVGARGTAGQVLTSNGAGSDATFQAPAAPSGAAGGDLAGTYPNPTLKATGPGVTSSGDATHTSAVTIDAQGRVTALASTPIALPATAVTGIAGLWVPADNNLLAANFDPRNTTQTGTNVGRPWLMKVKVATAGTVAKIWVGIQAVGSGLTTGQNFVALYNAAGTNIGTCADQTSAWGSTGAISAAVTVVGGQSLAVTVGQIVYVMILSNASTSSPTFDAMGRTTALSLTNANLAATDGYLAWQSALTAQTAIPGSVTLSTGVAQGVCPWVGLST